ncbi:MAG TPA: helix-turn-helix domain-containing protein [Candidatus Limnocylindrales bacterium]
MVRLKTRDEILSAAARQFASVGFKGASLQDIAAEVGCSKAALLYHFPSKDAILTALVAPAAADLAGLGERLRALDAAAARDAAIEGFADLVLHYRRQIALIFDELLKLEHPAFDDLRPHIHELVDACSGRSGDPRDRLMAEVTLAGISAVVLRGPDPMEDAIRESIVDVARRALVPPKK